MSRYGSDVTMTYVMRAEMDRVTHALDSAGVTGDERDIVIDALKETCYNWAKIAAAFNAFSERVKTLDSGVFWEACAPWGLVDAYKQTLDELMPKEWDGDAV